MPISHWIKQIYSSNLKSTTQNISHHKYNRIKLFILLIYRGKKYLKMSKTARKSSTRVCEDVDKRQSYILIRFGPHPNPFIIYTMQHMQFSTSSIGV